MKTKEHNQQGKNEYEQSIKQFIDDLDEKITVFEGELENVEELSRKNLKEEIHQLKLKKEEFQKQAEIVKNTSIEKWSEVSDELDKGLKEISKEIIKIYSGIKKGFSYIVEKLDK